jgi:V8-like Glu-specific endopeptidase
MKLRHPYLHFGLILAVLVFLAAIAVPDTAAANPKSSSGFEISAEQEITPGLVTARGDGVELTSTHQAWSLARMEAAQPYPLPAVDSLPQSSSTLNDPNAVPVYLPSVPPSNDTNNIQSDGDASILANQAVTSYDYPAPYTRYENFDSYQTFPYSAAGVLFFTQRGVDFRCSAAVVGENAVWTAGHCVHDGSGESEGWSEDVVFIPAYNNGLEPFGRWEYFDLVTRVAWHSGADLRYDFGGVILNPNGSTQSVGDVVGSLGFAFNLDTNQHWFNIAYPSESPFDGKEMQICAGSFARLAENLAFPTPVGMGCDMTKGSSGGAWIVNFSGASGNMNYVNGNNSFRYTGLGEEIYSPYFGEAAKDLLDFISTDTRMRSDIHIPLVTNSDDN